MAILRHIAVVDGGKVREIFSFSFKKNPQKPHHIACSPEVYKNLFGETPYESFTPKEFLKLMVEFFGKSDGTYQSIKRYIILTYPNNFVNQIKTD